MKEFNAAQYASKNWQEEARKFAESKMPENWNRKDQIEIGTFYKWYIKYINDNFHLIPK
jgi:hypothetical protein